MRFQNGFNKVVIELLVVQFWSEINTCDFKSNSRCALVRFWNHAYDFRPNCTPLSSITIINPGPPVRLSVENLSRSRGLKRAHLNVRSLMPKLDSLKILLETKPFDVFTVSETWLKPSILDNEIHLPGCSCVRYDRLGKVGGGFMAYVRDGIL